MAGARRGRGGGGRSRRSAPGVSWDPPDLYTPAHAGRRTHLPSHLARTTEDPRGEGLSHCSHCTDGEWGNAEGPYFWTWRGGFTHRSIVTEHHLRPDFSNSW